MTGTWTILSLASETKIYELQYVDLGGISENHSYPPANPSLFHILEHCRSSWNGGDLDYDYLEGRMDRN